jgi:hypothetical protein
MMPASNDNIAVKKCHDQLVESHDSNQRLAGNSCIRLENKHMKMRLLSSAGVVDQMEKHFSVAVRAIDDI